VAEIITFRLTPDSDETAFLAAARATAAAVAAQPGFLRRVLSRDDGGLWTDHVEWADRASAETAARAVTALPEFRPFVGFIDLAVMNMRHARVLWSMSN
jgi:quinol monooxygenase YgiN